MAAKSTSERIVVAVRAGNSVDRAGCGPLVIQVDRAVVGAGAARTQSSETERIQTLRQSEALPRHAG